MIVLLVCKTLQKCALFPPSIKPSKSGFRYEVVIQSMIRIPTSFILREFIQLFNLSLSFLCSILPHAFFVFEKRDFLKPLLLTWLHGQCFVYMLFHKTLCQIKVVKIVEKFLVQKHSWIIKITDFYLLGIFRRKYNVQFFRLWEFF